MSDVGAITPVPYELVDADTDDLGWRLRAALAASTETVEARRELIILLASFPGKLRVPRTWAGTARRVLGLLDQPVTLIGGLVDAALAAGDHVRKDPAAAGTASQYAVPGNEAFLRGTAAFAGVAARTELLPALRRLAVKTSAVTASGSPRSLGTAILCVSAIADTPGPEALTELRAVERSTRNSVLRKYARERAGALTPAADGGADTNAGASSSTAGSTAASERDRVEALFTQDQRWPVVGWRALHLDHPAFRKLADTLIWVFRAGDGTEISGIPAGDSAVVTSNGTETSIPDDAEVRLWHPADASADEIAAWRHLLLDREIAQPVRQAFREVYALTRAEQAARDYSPRFAAHIFRQAQARALLKSRGWTSVPLASWDDALSYGVASHGVARRVYDQAGIRAEFFFGPVTGTDRDQTSSGLYTYCVSDQVRFFDTRADQALGLADVPPTVFSEAMRDIGLLIDAASVGADPKWLDVSPDRPFQSYWRSYAFGELGPAGEIRRDILTGLLPRLRIFPRCALEERFLVVRGDLRTYRIHLRSGNILMSPDDRHLRVVTVRDPRAGKLFLPFEDPALSLILSKAFLLAGDSSITDPSIMRQISPA